MPGTGGDADRNACPRGSSRALFSIQVTGNGIAASPFAGGPAAASNSGSNSDVPEENAEEVRRGQGQGRGGRQGHGGR